MMLLCLVEHCCCGSAQLLSECLLQDVWGPIPHLASSHITLGPHSQLSWLKGQCHEIYDILLFIYLFTHIYFSGFRLLGIEKLCEGAACFRCRCCSTKKNEKKFPQGVGEIFKLGTYLRYAKCVTPHPVLATPHSKVKYAHLTVAMPHPKLGKLHLILATVWYTQS